MAIFLDTSGLLAIFHADEPMHEIEVARFAAAETKVSHSHVLAELVALDTARRMSRSALLAFLRSLLGHPDIEVV